jgi:uncharacterized membrane protein SirB2
MLAQHYLTILHLHVGCVVLSGTLFGARGLMRLRGLALANHRALRIASYLIDTALLTAAILLTLVIHQYPLANGWLTVKLAVLLAYIALGALALKRARSERGRRWAATASSSAWRCGTIPGGVLGLLR